MARTAKPFLYRGHFITTARGKKHKLATEAEGLAVAEARLRELLANPPTPADAGPLTVRGMLEKYLRHAKTYYRLPSGEPSREQEDIPLSCRELLDVAGDEPAASLGRPAFREARQRAIDAGLSRKVINQRWGRVRRLVKWATQEDLIPVAVLTEASLLDPLPANRSAAVEHADIEPVAADVVFATLATLPEPWASMVRLQWVTGMRPGEVVALRASYLIPAGRMRLIADFGKAHKMAYRGKPRRVGIGESGAMILSRWIGVAFMRGSDYLFPSPRTGTCVRRRSYDNAVAKAAVAAGVPHWHPNQLRHAFGTRVRAILGLDAAQAALGHAKADVTQVYAKLTDGKILEVADKV